MNSRTAITILFILFSLHSLSAQNKELVIPSKNTKKLIKEADWAFDNGDVFVANGYYQKLIELGNNDVDILNRLAHCQMMMRDYQNAENNFQKVYEKAAEKHPTSLFYWALMQKSNGKYSDAKINFEKFRKSTRKMDDKSWSKKNRIEIEGCDLALQLKDSKQVLHVQHLKGDINHPHIEFSPIPYKGNQLIYGSNKTDEILFYKVKKDNYKKEKNNVPIRKLYIATKNNNNEWISEGEWEGPFNDENHTGNGAFSLDGNRFYFTKCAKNERNKTICKIYISEKKNNAWSKAKLLNKNINLSGYTNTQPTVGVESRKGREVLYFVSDRPEGKGGWDIWYTTFNQKKNTYSEVRNAGRDINSTGTECTPYYHPKTKTLYFSSNGKPSVGGLDIFYAQGEKGQWEEEAKNIGFPLNSSADDLDYILRTDDSGFLVSNRKGGTSLGVETCCDDIYSFSDKKDMNSKLSLKVSEQGNIKPTSNSFAKIYILESNGKKLIEEKEVNNGTIDFILNEGKEYFIEISKDGFEKSILNFNPTNNIKSNTINKEVVLIPIKKSDPVASVPKPSPPITKPLSKPRPNSPIINFNSIKVGDAPIVLEDIYFEFDSDQLTPSSIQIIDDVLLGFLNKRNRAIILIAAHTDSKGNDTYNEKLSQRRAQSVIQYLIQKKGINPKRLSAKGFGEKNPRASNSNPDGTDNPEGRQKNRRVEFSVIGEL